MTFYRDAFAFPTMSYIDSNIPKSIFYSALVGEFLRTIRSSLLYKEFNEKAIKLFNRMKAQRAQSLGYRKALSKIAFYQKALSKSVCQFLKKP